MKKIKSYLAAARILSSTELTVISLRTFTYNKASVSTV